MPHYRRIRYQKPKTAMMSTVPALYGMRSWVDTLNTVRRDMPQRQARGMELVLLELAVRLRELVQRADPVIKVAGEPTHYAKALRIAMLPGEAGESAVAIYFENTAQALTEGELGTSVLYFLARPGAPPWGPVLAQYNPWPASLVPVPVPTGVARVVSRRVRADEVATLAHRLTGMATAIERELTAAGAPAPHVEASTRGVGIVTHQDVFFSMARKEFGYDGDRRQAAWVPAIQGLLDDLPVVLDKFVRYLWDGREGRFLLPDNLEEIGLADTKQGAVLREALAPFWAK